MIIDNTDNGSQSEYSYPLITYLRDEYSYSGNILIDCQYTNTILYIEIPYISKDAGHLFKLWFFDKLLNELDGWVGENHFNHGYNAIQYHLSFKETEDALIVQQKLVNACVFSKPLYNSSNNGTYSFQVVFPDNSLPMNLLKSIEETFNNLIETFRKTNNEITI